MPHVEVLQRGYDVEDPPASKRPAIIRSDNVREPVCNDIRLDGKRKHQRLREGVPGRKPVGAGRRFVHHLLVYFAFIDNSITHPARRRL